MGWGRKGGANTREPCDDNNEFLRINKNSGGFIFGYADLVKKAHRGFFFRAHPLYKCFVPSRRRRGMSTCIVNFIVIIYFTKTIGLSEADGS